MSQPSEKKQEFKRRHPDWLKVTLGGGENYVHVSQKLKTEQLHTVCQSARCPNQGACWSSGTATFLIMGDHCTRTCKFCAITKGTPLPLSLDEPLGVARSVAALQLKYAVITSVTRDDVPDFGAHHFAETIIAVKTMNPTCKVEVLIPDFMGAETLFEVILAAQPDILNHNVETVPRLYPVVRAGSCYERSLKLLRWFTDHKCITKTGLMLGLGEKSEEVIDVMRDLISTGCQILTLGQYLQPTLQHLPVKEYIHPDVFDSLSETGLRLGFAFVVAGPLVRSSYKAFEAYQAVTQKQVQRATQVTL